MKRHLFRLAVGVLTFLIGVASAMTFLSGVTSIVFPSAPPGPPDTSETAASQPPATTPEQTPVAAKDSARMKKIADLPPGVDSYGFSMQVLNEREIWISGEKRMWRTRNGGKDWEFLSGNWKGRNASDDIRQYQFINSNVGWLLSYGEGTSHLYKTTDGGVSWSHIAPPVDDNFNAFQFVDENRGWAAGTHVKRIPANETRFIRPRNVFMGKDALYAAIYYTEDGGKTWRQQPLPSRPNSLNSISMFDAQHGWAWGDAATFYLDGGRWREINYKETKCGNPRMTVEHLEVESANPYVGAASVSFISPRVGWMSHTWGYLAKTTDGGRTWCDLINPEDIWGKQQVPLLYFGSIEFLDAQHGYALDDDSLYETADGGATWARLDVGVNILGLDATDARDVWAASRRGLFKIVPAGSLDEPAAPARVDYFAHLKPEHREVLREWLKGRTHLRPAVEEVDNYFFREQNKANFEEYLKFLRGSLGRGRYQYYSVGDMNHDGRKDFAVLLVDARKTKDKMDHFALAIFNAPFSKGKGAAYYEDGLSGISNCYIVFDRERGGYLFLGLFESDVLCATYYPKGRTYYFKDCLG
jgi:photosystem II stability/assembly factor-like uncharacterized protein